MSKILQVEGCVESDVFRALASSQRRAVLEMLGAGPSSVSGIANYLGIDQPSASRHIQQLQKAGLVATSHEPGKRGPQKVCRRLHEEIVVRFPRKEEATSPIRTSETSIPLGSYVKAEVFPNCGMAGAEKVIGYYDDPKVFASPERIHAQIMWFRAGYVEYIIPRQYPADAVIKNIEVKMELSSDASKPIGIDECPSDISIWINGVKIGPWHSWGFYTGKTVGRGRYTPEWWKITNNQHGLWKEWEVNEKGSFVDTNLVSSSTVEDLRLNEHRNITLRIGIDRKDHDIGGVCLFGEKFGNCPNDILMTVAYERTTEKGNPCYVHADST